MKHLLNKRRLSWLSLVLIGTIGNATAGQGELWETRSSMSSPQFGIMELGSNRECQPPDWLDHPDFDVPGEHGECTSRTIERRSNGYKWSFACGATTGKGEVLMNSRDRFDGDIQLDTPQGRFTLTMQGRHIGDCELE